MFVLFHKLIALTQDHHSNDWSWSRYVEFDKVTSLIYLLSCDL